MLGLTPYLPGVRRGVESVPVSALPPVQERPTIASSTNGQAGTLLTWT
jgi:hypothetical protein